MHTELRSLLMDLECQLRMLGCWDDEPPAVEALASEQPFAIDTLEFYQWLQWIFLPRMHQLLDQQLPLPCRCQITVIAEEWVKLRTLDASDLLACLHAIDQLLEGAAT